MNSQQIENEMKSATSLLKLAMYEAGMKQSEIDNHETDLYVLKNNVSAAVIARYAFKNNVSTFVSELDGKTWYDIPFASFSEKSLMHGKTEKTNSRIVKERIRLYIVEHLSTDETEILSQQLENVAHSFIDYYKYEKKRYKYANVQILFGEYLKCLPSELSIDYYYYDIQNVLKCWVGTSEKQYSDEKALQLFLYLIYREFVVLCSKFNIDFYELLVEAE